MRSTTLRLLVLFATAAGAALLVDDSATSAPKAPTKPISSEIVQTKAGEQVLVQEVWLDAPVADVWKAYTTEEGWTAWASAQAKIDLKVGGTIRTRYDETGQIGDPGTNTLHIVNYVPEKVLTLRAELAENWPEILKKDADKLSNVILFDSMGEKRTRVRSYGIGYSDTPEMRNLLTFFVRSNEMLLRTLKQKLERR